MSTWQHVFVAIALLDAYAIFLFLLLVVAREIQHLESEVAADAKQTDSLPQEFEPFQQ